jgi:hypothetical protein
MAKKVKFGDKPKGSKKNANAGTDFNFGANVKAKGSKKRKGGFGGGS